MPAERVQVVPEDLVVSGSRVTVHAEELSAKHTAAASWMAASMPFLPASAATALAAKAAEWQRTTTTLTTRLGEHSDALHGSAAGYQRVDEQNAAAIDRVKPEPTAGAD